MDNIKPNRGNQGSRLRRRLVKSRPHVRPVFRHARTSKNHRTVRLLGRLAALHMHRLEQQLKKSSFVGLFKYDWRYRAYSLAVAILMFVTSVTAILEPYLNQRPHALTAAARAIIPQQNKKFGELLTEDKKTGNLLYNDGYQGESVAGESTDRTGTPRITAQFKKQASEGLSVTDTINKIDFTLKPKFSAAEARKEANQVFYRLKKADGYLVYTAQVASIKEDIVLLGSDTDMQNYEFELGITSGLEARLERNGAVGIYGSSLPISGEVSTGNDADKELLEKARSAAVKNKLLFTIPAPLVIGPDKKESTAAKSHFELEGSTLRIVTTGLKQADFPLSIDPSVYVETAAKLMRGNNETNLDFDVNNELIQKGKLTGARFNSWTNTMALPAARWGHATAVSGGYIYATGGSSGATNVSTVYWARLNTSTGAVEATNPGAGACADWCNNVSYDLPAARAGHSMVAYNGYLYVMGGLTAAGTRSSSVYIAKLGANGEPSLWHPTDTNTTNWTYWYSSTALSTERSYAAAVAYNNRVYLMGGQTNGATGGVATVEYADIEPTGILRTWTSTGMVAMPSVRHNFSAQVYNDRMYLIGGNSAGVLQSAIHYIKLSSTGTMTGAWVSTSAFTTARMSWGGNFATIWGGYIYVSGGCSVINASGYCTTIRDDVILASINADGSITNWGTISGVTSSRIGYGLVGWRNVLYGVGGCTAQNATNGTCTTTATLTNYGSINQDGDASTVSNSVANGVAPCASATWYDCDLPPEGNGNGQSGRMSGGTVVNNGYIYYIGGCTAVNAGSVCFTGNAGKTSDTISWAAIAVDGTLTRAATCTGGTKTYVGSWCVDNTNTVNGSTGLAAFGYTVFNNTIYAVGGTSGTLWQDNVWRTTTNTDGSINAWVSQTFTNLDLGNAKGYQYVFARSNPTSAGTYPANLYVLGGCSGLTAAEDGLDCSGTSYTGVYKCNITTTGALEEADANDCTTTGQLQIDSEPGTGGSQGLGVMAGTVYANYIYLIGGQSPNEPERGAVMYARIDNSNNIVDADGETIIDDIWTTSGNSISPVRRRGVAFGYNGYLYALAGFNVSLGGSLNDLLLAKIDVSDGSIGAFSTSQVTVNARWDLRVAVNNGYVYTIGGCSAGSPPASCTSMSGTVQTFQLYNNYSGSPASYSASANLFTTDRIGASAAVYQGYIYLAGGCTSATDCTTASTSVQSALINVNDGSVGAWSATGALPAVRVWGQLEVVGGTLYYMGGQDSTATNEQTTVYYTTALSNGSATWSASAATNGLPAARTRLSTAVWNNRIYAAGGLDAAGADTATVYYSPTLSTGGNITTAWTATTSFAVARSGMTTIAYANNLYVLGGNTTAGNYLTDVQYTQINSDGTLDPWSYSTSLPQGVSGADGYAYNGFMYLFGGRSAANTCTNYTYVAPISANTTIASGNNPTGVGAWYQTNVAYTTVRYGAAAAYYEGKAYILGGGCGATLTYTGVNRVVLSTLQSQPQVAKYSRFIDTDSNVFPNSWLLNGLDNSIGARWQGTYRSAYDASNLVFHESFDEGVNGNELGEIGSAAGVRTTYDNCYNGGAGSSNTFDSSWFITAGLSQHASVTSGTNLAACNDDFDDTSVRYDRFYLRFQGNPASNTLIYMLDDETTVTNVVAGLRITTTGTLQLRDNNTADGSTMTLDATTAGNRIEVAYVEATTSLTVRIFRGADLHGPIPTEVQTITLNNAGRDTVADATFTGIVGNVAAPWDVWIDDHKASKANWVGSTYPGWGQNTVYGDITLGDVAAFIPMAPTYSAGTITQSGTTVTAGGSARWVSEQVGATLTYQDGTTATISSVASNGLTMVVSVSKTIASAQTYLISNDNTDFARWYYFLLSIDASQSFGYPEDVSRGPTIADLSLFFTADPSKRLRHGKTFTGGGLQPLDTPCRQSVDAQCPLP